MEISSSQQSQAIVVAVKGRMDAVAAPAFERTMADHVAAGARRVVIDCAALEYISSAGLRGLLTTAKTIKARNGELVCVALTDAVREVFEITGFTAIFPIFDSVEAALQRLS
jgi:anti-sigma B factor antagonist